MSNSTLKPIFFLSHLSFPYGSIIHDALLRGRKASDEIKKSYRHNPDDPISLGPSFEGIAQNFIIQATTSVSIQVYFHCVAAKHTVQATVLIPSELTRNVPQKDFCDLLEVQRIEHLLSDMITSSGSRSLTNISKRYYSQVLMAQRLQRALLEVELYACAIARDGLVLLEGAP
jgi:hypothetical protein